MPQFGKILDIVVIDTEDCFFIVSTLITETFNSHYNAFEVQLSNLALCDVIRPSELADHNVYHIYNLPTQHISFILLKYHLMENI